MVKKKRQTVNVKLFEELKSDMKTGKNIIWERIWEKGPIGNFSRHEIAEKLLFQMLQTI